MSSAATKEEERKRTGLSQSFLDTRRSFYCEKLPDNGPRGRRRRDQVILRDKGCAARVHTKGRSSVSVCTTRYKAYPPNLRGVLLERPNLRCVLLFRVLTPRVLLRFPHVCKVKFWIRAKGLRVCSDHQQNRTCKAILEMFLACTN